MSKLDKIIGAIIIALLTVVTWGALLTYNDESETSSIQTEYNSTRVDVSPYEMTVLNAQDDFRKSKGMNTLLLNQKLSTAALRKAEAICNGGDVLWSHSPTGRPWYKEIQEAGYDYEFAGENLSIRFDDPAGIVPAWEASPKHLENLVGDFKDVGIGFSECGGKNITAVEYAR